MKSDKDLMSFSAVFKCAIVEVGTLILCGVGVLANEFIIKFCGIFVVSILVLNVMARYAKCSPVISVGESFVWSRSNSSLSSAVLRLWVSSMFMNVAVRTSD